MLEMKLTQYIVDGNQHYRNIWDLDLEFRIQVRPEPQSFGQPGVLLPPGIREMIMVCSCRGFQKTNPVWSR
jgi:hypothetical protein